jgi:hypothetical protein
MVGVKLSGGDRRDVGGVEEMDCCGEKGVESASDSVTLLVEYNV